MDLFLIGNIIAATGALVGFNYGCLLFFRPRIASYAQMITFAVGCISCGKVYLVIRMLTIGDVTERFQLGVLGVVGSLLFLFTANYGAMDGLADDRTEKYRKYRLIPLALSAVILAVYLFFTLFTEQPVLNKIVSGIITLLAICASYFNLKHLIFPDVDYGVIACLKGYNLLAVIYELLCVGETIAVGWNSSVLMLIIGILMCMILPAMVIAVDRGMKKWLA